MSFRLGRIFLHVLGGFLLIITLLNPSASVAACFNPNGDEADIVFNSTHNNLQYCDGTQWIAMGSREGLASPAANVPTTNLVGHWKFDEGSTPNTADSAGSNGGTLTNMDSSSDYVTGQVGPYALDFDGDNDTVALGNSTIIDARTSFTIAAWVNMPSAPGASEIYYVYSRKNAGASDDGSFAFNIGDFSAAGDTRLRFLTRTTGWSTVLSTGSVPTGGWHHVAVVGNAGSLDFYIDGVNAGTTAYNIPSVASGNVEQNIGGDTVASATMLGSLDDVRVYDRNLSSAEIAALFTGTGGTLTDPCSSVGPGDEGTICADGSVYAGTIDGDGTGPGGDVEIFITPYDLDNSPHTAPDIMSDGNTNRGSFAYKVNFTESSVLACIPINADPECHDGQTLTDQLVNGTGPDGPSTPSMHHAPIACDNLSFGGQSDWYLPSVQELDLIYDNLVVGAPDVNTDNITDDFGFVNSVSGRYWSSSESASDGGWSQRFSDGFNGDTGKSSTLFVRCARRGSAAAGSTCANPEGSDGDIIYNNTSHVMQYCADGNWQSMGPVPGAGPLSTPTGVATNLVAHWPLDNEAALLTPELIDGDDGAVSGGASISTTGGKIGGYAQFAENTASSINLFSTEIDGTLPYTIAAWVYLDSTPGVNRSFTIYGPQAGGSQQSYSFAVGEFANAGDTRLRVFTYDGAGNEVLGKTQLSLNTWHHAAAVYDGTQVHFYLDGRLDGSANYTPPSNGLATAGSIGYMANSGNSQTMDGRIDDVRLYDRALDRAEIAALAAYGFCTNPNGITGDMTYNTTSDVMQYCDGQNWVGIGKAAAAPPDTTPDVIAFPDGGGPFCAPGGDYVSSTLQVTGINTTAATTISGGNAPGKEFQICGATPCSGGNIITPWTSGPSTISNNQYIVLRSTGYGPGDASSSFTYDITIGTETYTWTINTGPWLGPC